MPYLADYLSLRYDLNIHDINRVKNVMRISTDKGDRCLKIVKYRKEDFLFILSAMKHLIDNGFDGIIPFIPAKDGELYVELKNGYGFLTEWISCSECDYSNPIELNIAATTLAKLHKASRGFEPAVEIEDRIGWGKWFKKFQSRITDMLKFKNIILQKSGRTCFDAIYFDNLDYHLNQARLSIEHLQSSKYLELMEREIKAKSFCHHDYAHHNVLISKDFKARIIDFDYCICDTRLHDLSSLIIRNMRHGNWDMEKAQYIIDCYLKEGYLEPDEIDVINAFIEFPQDFWQVGLQYYIEKQDWEENNFNKRLNNVINDKYDRKRFIEDFRYSIQL